MIKFICPIIFPTPSDIMINMMPIIIGDNSVLPENIHPYVDMIKACNLEKGSKAYLSINESVVQEGQTQRRAGIHTDSTISILGFWGGGWGGGKIIDVNKNVHAEGIYMASSDGACRAWNRLTFDVNLHGGLLKKPEGSCIKLQPNALYWLTDKTPHESLPAKITHKRQWFRLVTDNIGIWWAKHSTPNPFGISPNARIEHGSKF